MHQNRKIGAAMKQMLTAMIGKYGCLAQAWLCQSGEIV